MNRSMMYMLRYVLEKICIIHGMDHICFAIVPNVSNIYLIQSKTPHDQHVRQRRRHSMSNTAGQTPSLKV